MTTQRRFEQDLPDLLARLAMEPMPKYRDHVIQETARMRQRPAWTFPERWIPMAAFTGTTTAARPVPWRWIGLVALVIIALAGAIVIGGAARPPLPRPFGPARNGLIAYSAGGDIYTVDPGTGATTAVVVGPEQDEDPVWSRDGTHIAFRRAWGDTSTVFVARPDGGGLRLVTPEPLPLPTPGTTDYQAPYAFSPDGTELLLLARCGPTWIARTDGRGIRVLEGVFTSGDAEYRPPDGREIAYIACGHQAVRIVSEDGGDVRDLIGPEYPFQYARPSWSGDGSTLAYARWNQNMTDISVRARLVDADGSADRPMRATPIGDFDATPTISNDGTRIAVARGSGDEVDAVVLSVTGDDPGIRSNIPLNRSVSCCPTFEWAPDDTAVLLTITNDFGQAVQQMLLDPETGEMRPTPWRTTSQPSWQRLSSDL